MEKNYGTILKTMEPFFQTTMTIQLRFCGKNYDAMKNPYGTTQKLWYYNKLELAIVNYSILGFFLVRGYTYI